MRRATAVYQGALDLYKAVTDAYFPRLRTRFRLAQNLPARMLGKLAIPRPNQEGSAGIHYYFQPLPNGEMTTTDICLGKNGERWGVFDDLELDAERLRVMRGGAEWLYPVAGSSGLNIYGFTPITSQAAYWLQADLRNCGWWP